MYIRYDVTFEESVPTTNEFLDKLASNTGLVVEVEYLKPSVLKVYDPLIEGNSFSLIVREDAIWLGSFDHCMQYFLEAAIATLIVLGGKSNYNVQDDAFKKWRDVKETYKIIPLIDWDGTFPEEELDFS